MTFDPYRVLLSIFKALRAALSRLDAGPGMECRLHMYYYELH